MTRPRCPDGEAGSYPYAPVLPGPGKRAQSKGARRCGSWSLGKQFPNPQGYPREGRCWKLTGARKGLTETFTEWVSAGLWSEGTPAVNQLQAAKWHETSITEHARVSKGDP